MITINRTHNPIEMALNEAIEKRINDSKWYFVECGNIPKEFNIVDYLVLATAYIPSIDNEGNEVTLFPTLEGKLFAEQTGEVLHNYLADGVGNLQICVANTQHIGNLLKAIILGEKYLVKLLLGIGGYEPYMLYDIMCYMK